MTYPELLDVLDELELTLWDKKVWDMAMQTKNPIEAYNEARAGLDSEPSPDIESLSNKDWLRA